MIKPNIIFVHILKCGGTSLRYMLLDEYGYEAIAPVPIGQAGGDYGYPYLRGVDPLTHQQVISQADCEKQGYQVVMSHYDNRVTSRFPTWQVITMLRHPVSQLYSLYKFMRFNQDLKRLHPTMQEQSFIDWVTSGKAEPYYNTQTRFLSGHGIEDVSSAMSHLMGGRVVYGLVERFDDSVRLFNERFGWSMSTQHLNKTPSAPELSAETCAIVEAVQIKDMELYRVASELFDTQFED